MIGGIIGGGIGAAHEPVYVVPHARAHVYYGEPRRVCWKDRRNRTVCDYR